MKKKLAQTIRDIPDFPKKGILFKDITTLLNNPQAFKSAIDEMAKILKGKRVDYIVAAEARGFIFGGALAYKLKCGFVPVRKPGKLPAATYTHTYALEYGEDSLQIHRDAFKPGARVLVIDDLLATGGTARALVKLAKRLKGKIVGVLFLIELEFLRGRQKLDRYPVYSLIKF
ncbi:MAG: adenine phosphoribosyltransferase [Candidatus Omnitrophica bacterium]|nr:adenine phosphoribosyltransferase [Candidatus Omnitrophota bacterium]